ncbi:MAG: carboxypeptidase-like regulatory domain-containing protein [Candidatus Acidiferrales bacterium]
MTPGPFQLSIRATDFKAQTISGTLAPGEYHTVPRIALTLVPVVTQVVVKPQSVIAHEQLQVEEKQRVLAVFPNFYVSYLSHRAPLNAHQKFQLAWKSTFDPVTFFVVGAGAGLQEADGQFSGFGSGPEGYAKRYGSTYADVAIGTFLGDAVFPSLFKQDPRFFYKSSGNVRSRILYALVTSVICKGDNGRWQPDYSNFLGDFASGGLSNLYYPPQDRNGIALTLENVGIGIGARAASNLVQEFLIPKLTFKSPFSHYHHHQPSHS